MKRLTFAGIVLAVVLAPSAAWAQLPVDMSSEPTRETGGWVFVMAFIGIVLGLLAVLAVAGRFLALAPGWASSRAQKAAAGSPPVRTAPPALAPAIARPAPTTVAAEAAAAASAESIGEKAHGVEEGAVPVAKTTAAGSAILEGAPAQGVAADGGDVYEATLQELLAKGVPQKVAEARAKTAAKKAGG